MNRRLRCRTVCAGLVLALLASRPKPVAAAEIARVLPPPGVKLSADERSSLTTALEEFAQELADFSRSKSAAATWLPDVKIFYKAVRYALDLEEFANANQVKEAARLLQTGRARLRELKSLNPPESLPSWRQARGLVVRGYRSAIDDSVQPYGLIIPEKLDLTRPVPLYIWLHGRNDRGTDLSFIAEQERSKGQILPADAIVLRVFGRFCNAFKFAGEIDVLEAIHDVEQRPRNAFLSDPARRVLIGFSMGGAGCWHLAAHYPQMWLAACPGAGFVDTRRYLGLAGDRLPSWYEQKLWGLYDVPDYARNLFNYPVVAYSGELDKQKASADIMAEVFQAQGRALERIIGPKVEHRYEPQALQEIHRRLRELTEQPPVRAYDLSFQTRTLRYNTYRDLTIDGLLEHWRDSRFDRTTADNLVTIKTENIAAFTMDLPPRRFTIDGTPFGENSSDKPAAEHFQKTGDRWQVVSKPDPSRGKRHGLQGPIDDAFMGPFLLVTPTGKSSHPAVDRWVEAERKHFQYRWQCLFRGEAQSKTDAELTARDIRDCNLIVWGDPASNSYLAKVLDRLPLKWTADALEIAGERYAADSHVPALIFPNPLNPDRYLVINSGLTFREAHDGTNSQQTPKLPDWAVIDLAQPPDNKTPGKIVAADFFDEQWQVKQPAHAAPVPAQAK
ncbi:MAG TPA: hypothetical protein VFE24_06370 [Pirellulales bacterium]|nr:hypothetical protein [Pirellulales bacterium]